MATIDFGFELPGEIPDQQGKVSAPQVPGLSEDLKPAPQQLSLGLSAQLPAPQQLSPELSSQLPALRQPSPELSDQLAASFELEGPSKLERSLRKGALQFLSIPSYLKYAGAEMAERPFNLSDVVILPKGMLRAAMRMAFEPEDID